MHAYVCNNLNSGLNSSEQVDVLISQSIFAARRRASTSRNFVRPTYRRASRYIKSYGRGASARPHYLFFFFFYLSDMIDLYYSILKGKGIPKRFKNNPKETEPPPV